MIQAHRLIPTGPELTAALPSSTMDAGFGHSESSPDVLNDGLRMSLWLPAGGGGDQGGAGSLDRRSGTPWRPLDALQVVSHVIHHFLPRLRELACIHGDWPSSGPWLHREKRNQLQM